MSALVCRVVYAIFVLVFSNAAYAECVVLLHGLLRSDSSFSKMERKLTEDGYQVVNQGYDSRSRPVEELAPETINQALKRCEGNKPVSFVTHSMGGILVRYYLKRYEVQNLNAVVMLAPPNAGSEVVDKLGDLPLFYWINGPAGEQLGTDDEDLPKQLGAVDYNVGIIAGDYSFNPVLSTLIPGPDDGKVSIDSAKLEGMTDYLVLPVSHIFVMKNNEVIKQTINFLKSGKFAEIQK